MTEMTQTGFSDNGAGALSYIVVLPAIFFLAVPPYNKSSYVRFHAWQSIFFAVACVAMYMVLAILVRIPFIGWAMVPLMLGISLGMFCIWLVVVLKALNGNTVKLPVLGAMAENQANK